MSTRAGNRLSKIVTRTGDAGATGLGDGSRIGKDSLRIESIGTIDELNSCIGVLLAEPMPDPARLLLLEVQHDLLNLGGELCCPGMTLVTAERVVALEKEIETLNADLSRLKEFILPGGCRAAALAHLARTVCRRAERDVVRLAAGEQVETATRQYLNRLSDLLFVLGRVLNREAGVGDILWMRKKD